MTAQQWHARETAEVVKELATDLRKGLSSTEAARRLSQYGTNELRKEEGVSPLALFLG